MESKFLKVSVISSLMLSVLLGSSSIANADSGSSALPAKDSALHQSYYRTYAPKTQTTFKEFATATQPVDKIIADANDIRLVGGILTGGGVLANVVKTTASTPFLGTGVRVAAGLGGGMVIVGNSTIMAFDNFKKGSIVKNKIYFRWTNPERLEYATKVESWVEYQGKPVTAVRTSTYSKTL